MDPFQMSQISHYATMAQAMGRAVPRIVYHTKIACSNQYRSYGRRCTMGFRYFRTPRSRRGARIDLGKEIKRKENEGDEIESRAQLL